MVNIADFSKFFAVPFAAPFAGPKVTVEGLIELQKRNFTALVAANAKLAEGAQAILTRQAEIMQVAMAEGLDAARRSMNGQPVDVEKQIGIVKESAEKTLASAREIAEMAGQSSSAAFDILRQRANESVAEVGDLFKTAA